MGVLRSMILLKSLFFIGIIVVSFLISNGFRLRNKYTGSDAYFHYQAAEQLRKNHLKPYNQIEVYIVRSPSDYPPLIHYILALLPQSKLVSWGRFFGSFFDVCNKGLVFLISYLLTDNSIISLVAMAIYSCIVLISQEQIEASPRSLGSLIFTMHMLMLVLYGNTPHWIYLAIAVFCVFLSYITHRFAFQTVVFTNIFLSLYFKNPIPIAILFLGIIISIVILRKHFFLLWRSMISTYSIWFKMRNVKKIGKRGYSKILISCTESFLFNHIDLLVLFLIISGFNVPSYLSFFIIYMIFLRIMQILVFSFKELKCIGEHFRYLAYNAAPASLVLSYLIVTYSQSRILVSMVILSNIVSLIALFLWQREYKKSKFYFPDEGTITSLKKIAKITTGGNLLVLDYPYARNVGYLTKKRVFFTLSQRYFYIVKELLWPTKPLEETIKMNRITDILVHRSVEQKYTLKKVKKTYQDDYFSLYKVLNAKKFTGFIP